MKIPAKWVNILGIVVIMLLAMDVVVLSLKNRDLKNNIREITGFEPPEPLESGTLAEKISVTLLDGRNDSISYDEVYAKYLLFVFSTTCPHCEANIPRWKSLNEKLDGRCFIIAISIHDVERTVDYVTKREFPFYTVSLNDSAFYQRYKISGVPVTILVAGDATVEGVWRGELNDEQVGDIVSRVTDNATASLNHQEFRQH